MSLLATMTKVLIYQLWSSSVWYSTEEMDLSLLSNSAVC